MESSQPPSGNVWVLLISVGILILLSMCFSASESAFLSINKLRIRFLRSQKDKRAERAGRLLDKKENLLNTLLFGNNVVNIAVSSLLTSAALSLFGDSGVGIATITATILLLIFGEIVPKTIGVSRPEGIAFILAPLITIFVKVLNPIVKVFTAMASGLSALAGVRRPSHEISFTEEDIKTMIEVGEEEGVLESDETKMLHKVFKFTDLSAKEIMVPRTSIVAVQADASYDDILELSRTSHFSRFPIYGTDIDDILGILYIKDFLFYSGSKEDFSIRKLLRPPVFILENKTIFAIQQLLREYDQNVCIVLDEYSGTAGLITMEDLVEEIFGGIDDEYDKPAEESVVHINEEEAVIDGTVRLIDLSERLGISLESEYYDTIGGYITEKTGDLPTVGAAVEESGYLFTAVSVTDRRITEVRVQKLPEEKSE